MTDRPRPPAGQNRAEQIARVLLRRRFVETLPSSPDTLLDFGHMLEIARTRGKEYRAAEPFPFIVLDDFLPTDAFRAVYDALPRVDDPGIPWGNLNAELPDGRSAQAIKYHLDNYLFMRQPVRQLISELNSGPFTVMLSELTGIDGLISDPLLQGGGVHIVQRGGLLRIHADFRAHPNLRLERRLNLLLYMNPGWKEEYGGHLELWTKGMDRAAHKLLPVANRCVIFSTGAHTYHGHPYPLECPESVQRKSIALYYYTAPSVKDLTDFGHGTDWQDLPEEKAR